MRIAFLAAALCLTAPAFAADRNYGVSGFDRVRLDGDYRVTLTTGVAPFAKASGDARAIDGVSIRVEGRTLIIRSTAATAPGGYSGMRRGPVTIAVGTHELTSVQVNGAGALKVSRAEGLKFDATAIGAGALIIDEVEVDQFTLALAGAANARMSGRVGKLRALVRGMAVLDAEALSVKDADLAAEGPATVRLTASETAKVTAAGVANVALGGNPACTLTVKGSAEVSGCRSSAR